MYRTEGSMYRASECSRGVGNDGPLEDHRYQAEERVEDTEVEEDEFDVEERGTSKLLAGVLELVPISTLISKPFFYHLAELKPASSPCLVLNERDNRSYFCPELGDLVLGFELRCLWSKLCASRLLEFSIFSRLSSSHFVILVKVVV
ncbi:hypothetical protein KFL_006580140 [Klebsormidium nitens]|uniref:Uncharacterized protein n=1 Tax=Klebsormidium nitens TaxID=105231 RepID=A0A1Y1IIF7_KLENI|nr:hypothetical protein KFL_006580140 [Klebsormidium nitens]|eukprot:GAQ90584.1 hypothetical protein KFL_006580140 [Klebsormidium nitens]